MKILLVSEGPHELGPDHVDGALERMTRKMLRSDATFEAKKVSDPSVKTHRLKERFFAAALFVVCLTAPTLAQEYKSGIVWPKPKMVNPGPVGGPPSDAIVLFGGKDLSKWNGGEKWLIKDGVATPQGGGITTKDSFGDCQLHVEWASPSVVRGSGQGRGNSGIYLMGKYEIQILDSYENETYFDGQAGALYKQAPPLVNASRKPGEWQTYDIIFKAPRFDQAGKLMSPGHVTVLHNGVLIQNHTEIQGTTAWHKPPAYEPHGPKAPISIQYHGNPVRFRNIWIRTPGVMIGKKPRS